MVQADHFLGKRFLYAHSIFKIYCKGIYVAMLVPHTQNIHMTSVVNGKMSTSHLYSDVIY